MQFGELLTQHRKEAGLSLRDFARVIAYDASNVSKIERGVISPPKSGMILKKWALALGLEKDSSEFNDFVATGLSTSVQRKVKNDAELARLMPAFFRTVENRQIDPATYKRLKDILKQNT